MTAYLQLRGHFLILYGEGFVSENEAADLFRHGEVPIDFIDRRPDRSLKDGIGFQGRFRSEEHTPELQSIMRISYAVSCLQNKRRLILIKNNENKTTTTSQLIYRTSINKIINNKL